MNARRRGSASSAAPSLRTSLTSFGEQAVRVPGGRLASADASGARRKAVADHHAAMPMPRRKTQGPFASFFRNGRGDARSKGFPARRGADRKTRARAGAPSPRTEEEARKRSSDDRPPRRSGRHFLRPDLRNEKAPCSAARRSAGSAGKAASKRPLPQRAPPSAARKNNKRPRRGNAERAEKGRKRPRTQENACVVSF